MSQATNALLKVQAEEALILVEEESSISLANSPALFTIANSDSFEPIKIGVSRELLVLAVILSILQIADGVLTTYGLRAHGIEMEANPLLRNLMTSFGIETTLFAVKSFSLLTIATLVSLSSVVPWLTLAFRGMVALYALFAVIPWSAILLGLLN